MTQKRYDVVVVGGGAAGLNGALVLGRARRSVLVVDSGQPRNAPAEHMHGFISRDGTPPADFLEIGRAELGRYPVDIVSGKATSASTQPSGFTVELSDGTTVQARKLLLATGVVDELPDIPGISELWGRGVLHCPYCHGWEVQDEPLGVLSTGPLAAHQALMFRQWSDKVTFLQHTGPPPQGMENVELLARGIPIVEGEVTALAIDNGKLTGARLANGTEIPLHALIVAPNSTLRTELLDSLGLEAVEHPAGVGAYIEADQSGLSAVPGVWVAGNLANLHTQVLASAASGVNAAVAINSELISEDTQQAIAEQMLSQEFWDKHYGRKEQVWSGNPNGTLVVEVDDLTPGKALDVGCGEGADSIWLAGKGWQVTGSDVSEVALDRAAAASSAVNWSHTDLSKTPPPAAEFDLVTLHYVTVPHNAMEGLLAAVTPGGMLLVVSHDMTGHRHPAHNPDEYVLPENIAALLGDDWKIVVNEVRDRVSPAPEGSGHVKDVVFRAQRLR